MEKSMKVSESAVPRDRSSLFETRLIFALIAVLAFALGISLALHVIWMAGIVLFLILLTIFLWKKELLIYLILLTLYFEGRAFSFYLFDARIRASQIIEVMALITLFILVFFKRIKIKKSPLDLFLWLFVIVNFVSVKNSSDPSRTVKISILLLSLVLLYYVVIHSIGSKKTFLNAFNLLLVVGFAEISYGLYQVFAGMGYSFLGIKLPIGHSGLMQQEFLQSPWGRPYGTFVEPDWFGTIAMFYAVVFVILSSSEVFRKKRFYRVGVFLSLAALFFSFVRGSWIGFVISVLILILLRRRMRLKILNFQSLYKLSFVLVLFLLTIFFLSPTINNIVTKRVSLLTNPEHTGVLPRLMSAKYAMMQFLKHPLIGNGPGDPIIQEETEEYDMAVDTEDIALIEPKFISSLIIALLHDSGIIGFALFFLVLVQYVRFNIQNIPRLEPKSQIRNLALFVGVISLFISYILTSGLWIPFTWVFLALNIVGIQQAAVAHLQDNSKGKLNEDRN